MRNKKGQFQKGVKAPLTSEQEIKKREALKASWRKREGYTDGLRGTSFHNSWRAIVFTIKGKKAGLDSRWLEFKNFKEDMFEGFTEGLRLSRVDKKKSFTKSNCRWVHPNDLVNTKEVFINYKGESRTIKEWCLILNLNYNGVRQRYYKGKNFTTDEVFFGKKKRSKRGLLNASQLKYKDLRLKASKMISAYKCKDLKKGFKCDLNIEWMIDEIFSKSCTYCDSKENIGCDRINNKKGHLISNIVPSCYRCNVVRSDIFTFNQMKKIGKFLRNQIDKK